ncbi:hypothetical protein E2542_SST00797 [Spatholobus suberectus]|nr:hypothetical protein E2542_SST00797 [Spatholobus suberectus]
MVGPNSLNDTKNDGGSCSKSTVVLGLDSFKAKVNNSGSQSRSASGHNDDIIEVIDIWLRASTSCPDKMMGFKDAWHFAEGS